MGWQDAPVVGGAQAPQPQQAQPRSIGGTRVLGGVPASEQRAQQDQQIQLETLRATQENQRISQANEAERIRLAQESADRAGVPSGYQRTPGGGLAPIPGGPADPATKQNGAQGNAVPQGSATKAESEVAQFTALLGSLGTFDDNFGGNWAGGLENTAQSYLPEGMVGTEGQSEWWANFRRNDNQIRNELFGATLTPSEQAAYSATSITPGMNAGKIRANLQNRTEIIENALSRRYEFYLANGYRKEAVDALFAPLLDRRGMAAQASEGNNTPAALGGETAPPAGNTPPGGDVPPGIGPNGDGRILGNTHNGGDDAVSTGIETGENRREDDPVLAGVRESYTQRLMDGQGTEQILRYLRSAGVTINEPLAQSVREQVAFRAEHPEVPAGEYGTSQLDDRFINVDPLARGIGNVAQHPVGTYVVNAGDAATGFNLDSMVGMAGGNAEQARLGIDQVSRENPVSALMGSITGGALTALSAEAGLARAGVAAALPRTLMADGAYGAVSGAGMTDYAADGSPATMADRAIGGAKGAVAGVGGSYAGQRVGNALAGAARGGRNAAVNALRGEGVNALTIGQTVGGSGRLGSFVKGAEDRLAGVPIVGDMINARRTEGVRQFNTAAFNKALEPIGGTVAGVVGEEAIAAAQDQVSQAYVTALAGKGALPDRAFENALSEAVMGVGSIKRLGDELHQGIGEIFQPYADDAMLSGEALDDISRNLRDLKQAYRQDPLYPRVVRQVDRIERAVFDLFDRQASGTIPEYMAARQAYRRVSTLEDAVMKARNQDDRVFTPAQLGQADQANTRRFGGKRAAARGDTPFYDLQTAGQAVLPNKVPDSGTAGRMLVPLALVGGGGGVDAASGGGGTGLTIGAILASLYTRTGQRILTKASRGMTEGTRRRAVLESPRTKRAIQIGAASGSAAALTDQR